MSNVTFAYHSTDPGRFSGSERGARIATNQMSVPYLSNLGDAACVGAIALELDPGRYIAVQTGPEGTVGFSWIIDVDPPQPRTATVVR